jgi:hypothetical protein
LITSGDTGTVTNTMLAGSIADSKLLQITTAGKVATSALTGTLFTLGTTAIAFNSKYNCWNGVNHFDISLLVL